MTNTTNNMCVRMPPSPTGNLHIGTARTALFNYLFAKKYGAKFVFRSEDTDKERSKREYEDNIVEGLKWLGIHWDEFYRQSERTSIYVSYLKKMIENGSAYISKEEPKEEGQRDEVIRFKNPNKKVAFDDLVRGTVEFDTTELGDFVIARSIEEPLYHLAVVVDDFEMGVTHVLRGEDHISNTPRQILIQEAIGAPRPIYAHMPLIFDAEHKKLSKRKHGDIVWIDTYKNQGYIPDALLNFFALMGWNPGTEQEIFTLEQLIEAFDINRVQKGAAVYNLEKLRWVNKEHLKLHIDETKKEIDNKLKTTYAQDIHPKILDLAFERIEVISDIDTLIEAGEFAYFFEEPTLDKTKLVWKSATTTETIDHLEKVLELIPSAQDIHSTESLKEVLMPYAEEAGKGNVLWPLRFALSGREKSPDPFTLIAIFGKDKTFERVRKAIELLQ